MSPMRRPRPVVANTCCERSSLCLRISFGLIARSSIISGTFLTSATEQSVGASDWLKMKNSDAPAVKREEEEEWGKKKWR